MKIYLIQPRFEDEIPVRSITLDFKIDEQKRTCHAGTPEPKIWKRSIIQILVLFLKTI